MTDFQQEYVAEAKQLLKALEQSLLQLDKEASAEGAVDTTYRLLHTLKGGAGMLGFTEVERLAHELEYVFSDIRDGVRKKDDVVIDLALRSIDVFDELINGNNSIVEVDEIIRQIHKLKGEPEKG